MNLKTVLHLPTLAALTVLLCAAPRYRPNPYWVCQ